MKSSEDIQSGIYLDIMDRSMKKNYSTEGRYSMKSKISDTLHSKFGSNHQLRVRNEKNKADFDMDWATFK
jgi:ribosomal protein L20A (L18A)